MELEQFCRNEPWNFAKWSAEFGKICHRKLWALIIINCLYKLSHRSWFTASMVDRACSVECLYGADDRNWNTDWNL